MTTPPPGDEIHDVSRTEARGAGSSQGSAADVLIVAEDGEAGGIGRYCVDLAALLGSRADVVCLCPTACEARNCWLADQCSVHEVRLHRVPMPARGWRRGFVGLVQLWRSRGRPAIHVNGRRGNFVSFVARLVVPGYRFVTTAHGLLGLHARRNAIYRVIDLAATRAATAVIAVSADTRRLLIRAGSPAKRTIVILNGLGEADMAAFRSAAQRRIQRHPGAIRVGFLGRLSPEKGASELLRVARGLQVPVESATLAIGGDGPDREWLTLELRDLSERGRVRLLGPVRDVVGFLGDVDILVMPSHNEGMPYVLLEAMAAGCTVVAFRVGGIPEVVVDASLGVLVEPGDVDALISAVIDLAADPSRVSAIGQAAAAHIGAHFALRDRLPALGRAYGRELAAVGGSDTAPDERAG